MRYHLAFCLSFSLLACDEKAPAPAVTDADTAGARRERTGVVFDPRTTRVGDTVAGLVVTELSVHEALDGAVLGTARFSGPLSLAGRSLRHHDFPEVQAVCFEADSAAAQKMPRWGGDRRRSWFCFSNGEYASRILAGPGSEIGAEIVIDGFTIHRGASDEVNEARLVKVLRKDEE